MPHLSRGLDVFACFLIKSVVWQRGNQVPQVRVERQFQRMKKQTDVAIEAHVVRGASYLLLLLAGTAMAFFGPEAPTKVMPRTLTFAERVSYQRAIEDVYWRHRIWPKENPNSKPSLDAVMSQAQLEKKVEDYLVNSEALEDYGKEPLSAEQLQAEMERMARDTKQPELLRELFEALSNDPFVIAECLARPVLAERMTTGLHVTQSKTGLLRPNMAAAATVNYTLPTISDGVPGCIDDTWTATSTTNAPVGRELPTGVWTGSEMIVWGGTNGALPRKGGRYNPNTDSWIDTSTTNAPTGRWGHTAVWTGSEMIVWGGLTGGSSVNSGGRYNPTTNTWTATSTTNAPTKRLEHTAVWTGNEMIVWGGGPDFPEAFNTGGRYCAQSGSPTPTPTPTPGPIQLRGQGKKVEGINTSRLKWRGATSANVDIYRDGVVIATTPNDGLYDDSTGTTGQASFTYQVCEAGISTCSNEVTVNFPP